MPPDEDGPTAPAPAGFVAHAFFAEVDQLLGDRLGESRFDDDRGLRVTVIDLDDDDTTAITALASAHGIADWVRVEQADPTHLELWERLRHDLIRLAAHRATLTRYPTPDPGYRRPPVEIHLFAGAEAEAAGLHDTYGAFVSLQVGALPYPPAAIPSRAAGRPFPAAPRDTVDPAELTVALESPLSVPSGGTVTHAVVLTNHSDHDVTVHTDGTLTAAVVAGDGTVVGGFVGPQILPLVPFTAPPSGTVRIPLLVGTASHVPELGYAIPPGTWQLTAPLDLADGRRLASAPLAFTVTA